MSQLLGIKIEKKDTLDSVTVSWKQGSVLGVGGNASGVYKVFVYSLSNSAGSDILVFVQDGKDAPNSLNIDHSFQFGCQNGSVFLVLHDKSRKPYQFRFVENKNLAAQIAKYANTFSQSWTQGYDFSWIVGDYLRDF